MSGPTTYLGPSGRVPEIDAGSTLAGSWRPQRSQIPNLASRASPLAHPRFPSCGAVEYDAPARMLSIQSTPTCRRTFVLLLLLHELGCTYNLETKEPSYFLSTHNTLGPGFLDGDFLVLELDTILRYVAATHGPELLGRTVRERAEVDQMLELHTRWWQAPLSRVARMGIDPTARHSEITNMKRTLNRLEQRLASRQYVVGEFSLADCPGYLLGAASMLGIDLNNWPAVQAYLKRLGERPAYRAAAESARRLGFAI